MNLFNQSERTADVETCTSEPNPLLISKEQNSTPKTKGWIDAISTRTIMWALLGTSAIGALAFMRTSPHAVDTALVPRMLDEEAPTTGRGVPKIIEEKLAAYLDSRDKGGFNKIVGGDVTTISNAPWQIALVDYDEDYWPGEIGQNYFQFCGGSIIDASWVATAAHCVDDPFFWQWLRISAGNTYAYGEDGTGLSEEQFVPVSEVYVHHNWNSAISSNDIALLKLATPLTLDGTSIAAINFVRSTGSSWPLAGTDAVISGWGTTSSGGDQSNQLKSATIDVLTNPSNKFCGKYSKTEYLNSVMLCAGIANGGVDTCQGDSGGPLAIYDTVLTKWFLGGITSWGNGCADKDYPGIYTRVTAFIQWMQSIVSATNVRLTVYVTGGGSVISNPAGVNCFKECNTKIAPNKAVLLTAKAASGKVFLGWSGICAATTKNKCTVKISQASSVTAIFS
jgi:secreted trypsin-like serine protease